MEPATHQAHPVDQAIGDAPQVRSLRRSARLHLKRLQSEGTLQRILAFETVRNQLDGLLMEVAYNIGVEHGLVIRGAAKEAAMPSSRSASEAQLTEQVTHALLSVRADPRTLLSAVLQTAQALSKALP